jgi:hypothetical protein
MGEEDDYELEKVMASKSHSRRIGGSHLGRFGTDRDGEPLTPRSIGSRHTVRTNNAGIVNIETDNESTN